MAKHPPESEHESAFGEQSTQARGASQPTLGRVSRRSFLSHLGAAGIAATAPPLLASAPPSPAPTAQEAGAAADGATTVTLRVNGKDHPLEIDPRTTLLDCLRENLNLPRTKKDCDHPHRRASPGHINARPATPS